MPEPAMKKIIFFLVSLGFIIPGYSFAATQDIHIEWTYDFQSTEGRTLAGYYLYQEGVKICTNNTPTDRTMDCSFESNAGTFNFTLTSFCTDGYESPHSSPYAFTLTTPSEPTLLAAFTNNPTSFSGAIPFAVSFDASSSTGDITSYNWNFGDGSSASGIQTSHTYTTDGTFNATLSVTSSKGSTSQKSVTVNTTVPQASANNHDIHIVWTYDFQPDDGRILEGYYLYKEGTKICTSNTPTDRSMDCTFESPEGTFDFTLTAFCTDGYESPHSSPYTFTLGTSSEPDLTAAFGTTPITLSGDTPFTVSFDASTSTGNIASYSWNFGDNSTGSSVSTSHTYTTPGIHSAVLTVTSDNGATSQKSIIITTTTPPAPPVPPVAVITPGSFSGDAPLTVSFNGSSSTSAVSYTWVFGDGTTANNSQVNHTFTTAGTFTTTLTVTNAQGQTHSSNAAITVKKAIAENTPPTATINSSTAMGEAPFSISFEGDGSHDNDGDISSYLWNFGDGSQTKTTANTTHIYTIAGTYSASLTVTDNQGATNTISTPVIITAQTVENIAPSASFTVSATEGEAPLEVVFDGSASTDPENAALTYSWNFGDGSSSQGVTNSHIYTSPGSFTAALTVTDEFGASSSATTTINTGTDTPEFHIELGEVEIDHNWITINFSESFIHPVVVAGAPSRNGTDPCVIRLRNITPTGFEIRIQEWTYLDGVHYKETVAYLVMEQGNFTLDDGTLVEARQFTSSDTNFQTVQFNKTFTVEPVVMTSIATFNEEDTVTGRLKNISATSFDHKTQEQELSNGHGSETVNYIAWEPSHTTIDNIAVIVNKTANKVKNRWYNINFGEQLTDSPIFLGTMQSQDGQDSSAIRYSNKTDSNIKVMIEEEKSADNETRHTSEAVGYFLFSNGQTSPPKEVNIRINNGMDDAEEGASGSMNLNSSDLELVEDTGIQTIGLRFTSIDIPKQAQITNAYIEFETDETGSSESTLEIFAEDTANSTSFSANKYDITNRQTSTDSIIWNNLESWNKTSEKHKTPDLSTLIQAIIDKQDWNAGNALSIIINGSGRRTAESYDGEHTAAPLLHIEFQ
jgi:PKD repeat protein